MQRVTINGLTKRFGETLAVNDVYLDVAPGEMVTLLGPSGCGKTTTLNMLAGFEQPDAGEIYVGDRLIASTETGVNLPPSKRNLGMVFQSYGLWPHMTVRDNIGYGLRMRGIRGADAAARIDEALRLVRMAHLGDRYPGQLSGGQQQRVSFARAVTYGPDVLLLDEPLSNLDAALREEMRLELKDLQTKTGLTTLFVTHDQLEAMVMSDRIVVMNGGVIVQIGTPEEIYERPANRFVAGFIGITNFLEGEVLEPSSNACSVRVGDAVLTCPAGAAVATGERVLLSVRPQEWRVSAERPNGEATNILSGEIEKVVYLGGSREIWSRCRDQLIRIHTNDPIEVAAGQTVWHWAPPEAVRVIPDRDTP